MSHGEMGANIAASLRESILAGRYKPGERIKPAELTEQYRASRIPVRDALRLLESEGLVTSVANTGAWVATLSVDDLTELYLVREHLEPLLLRMNVPLMSDDNIDELQQLADAMELSDDVERFLRLDREFHLSALRHAHTSMLSNTVLGLWNRTQHYRREATRQFFTGHDRSVHHDHHLIVNALRHRDEEEAEHVLRRHIRRSRLELSRHPEIFAAT
ncbi:hypothetical protein TZ00_14055 [Agreia bicolorata]|uniref:HTH gntR-type domain-containing protein n=1 Tax=Agreia bicolorata TaxID=110935 RepID=A0ABR5CDM8_9MICO|nr:hypothetical protein TZ00_14055 [Agreia bicolorata]